MARIGKFAIDSLTSSMYEDWRSIYREYIQNAADQIDEAVEQHLEEDDYYSIHVRIFQQERKIIIEDTATGVKQNDKDVLLDIGDSTKKRGKRKGFRGIGRIGGIGYCKVIKFETTAKGEKCKTTVIWDAAKMNTIIDDENDSHDASEVIDMCTNSFVEETEQIDSHYFRVILEDVTRDELLDVDDIKNYLSMVAPVDYPTSFLRFSSKIKEYAKNNNLELDVYNVFVGDEYGEEQIYKKYTTKIVNNKEGDYDINDIEFFSHKDVNGNFLYWGWYSISELKGIIQSYNPAYGIRLRCKNIQLGNAETCKIFYHAEGDKRFAQYFYGELHVVGEKLLPNARRDYLKENDARTEFERIVSNEFILLKELCNDASQTRSAYKGIIKANAGIEKEKKKKREGFVSETEKQKSDEEYKKFLANKAKEEKKLEAFKKKLEEKQSPLAPLFSSLNPPSDTNISNQSSGSNENQEGTALTVQEPIIARLRTDNEIYKKFGVKEKKVINQIYDVIYNTIVDEAKRDSLINKIERELTK
jgi:molecular chaperone HtpG